MFQSPLRSSSPVCAGVAAILSQVSVLSGGCELLSALWTDSHPCRVLPAGWIWVTVVPCRPAFFRAELLPAPPRILRKQAATVWADVHILIFTDHVVAHGICPPFTFILRRIEKPTIGKSQKIPEIHGDIFCFPAVFSRLVPFPVSRAGILENR